MTDAAGAANLGGVRSTSVRGSIDPEVSQQLNGLAEKLGFQYQILPGVPNQGIIIKNKQGGEKLGSFALSSRMPRADRAAYIEGEVREILLSPQALGGVEIQWQSPAAKDTAKRFGITFLKDPQGRFIVLNKLANSSGGESGNALDIDANGNKAQKIKFAVYGQGADTQLEIKCTSGDGSTGNTMIVKDGGRTVH